MGVLSRFRAIFQAKASQVVDQMEDPKASLDYSLVKLEDSRRQIGRSLVEVSAARTRLEHQRDELVAAAQKYGSQAEAAVGAWRALQRKEEAAGRRAELAAGLANLEQQENHLKQSQATLEPKIEALRSKKHELTSLYSATQAQLRVQEALAGISEDLLDLRPDPSGHRPYQAPRPDIACPRYYGAAARHIAPATIDLEWRNEPDGFSMSGSQCNAQRRKPS